MSPRSTKSAGSGVVVGALVAFLAGCSFGLGGAVSQIVGSHGFSIMQVCFAQYTCAAILLGLLVLVRFRPTMTRKEMLQMVFLGAISSISSFTYYQAITLIGVSAAVAIQFQYVWMVVVIQALAERKVPGRWTAISSILIVVGTFFGSGMADEVMSGGLTMEPLGLVYAIICALFYAIFIYFSGRVAPNAEPVSKTFFGVLGGFILIACLTPSNGGFGFDVAALAPWGLIMGVIMSIVPVLFIVVASSLISGSLVAVLTSSELPMAVFAGFLLLHEEVTPLIVFGVVVILGAICLAQLDNKGNKPVGKLQMRPEETDGSNGRV